MPGSKATNSSNARAVISDARGVPKRFDELREGVRGVAIVVGDQDAAFVGHWIG